MLVTLLCVYEQFVMSDVCMCLLAVSMIEEVEDCIPETDSGTADLTRVRQKSPCPGRYCIRVSQSPRQDRSEIDSTWTGRDILLMSLQISPGHRVSQSLVRSALAGCLGRGFYFSAIR